MADAIPTAIKGALTNRLAALTFSPAIPVAYPWVAFTPPTAAPGVVYLRATILPADTATLSVGPGSDAQHYGIFQVDVFYGQGSGELAPSRIADVVMAWFKRGTTLTKDSAIVTIWKEPYAGRVIKDDPWIVIPVSISYIAFAPNPA